MIGAANASLRKRNATGFNPLWSPRVITGNDVPQSAAEAAVCAIAAPVPLSVLRLTPAEHQDAMGKLITHRCGPSCTGLEEIKLSVKKVEAHLSGQLELRERVLKDSRDVISACSKAIIGVHTRRMKEAERELTIAKTLLQKLKAGADGSVSRYLVSPETEFVEASAVIALAKGRRIPSLDSLKTSPEAYLLGLLDTVGELKRLVLDSIMRRDASEAKRYFETMEGIYATCSPLAVFDHVANGARRKIDVARMLAEDTRGLIAEETRREEVSRSMARLERKLGSASSKRTG